MRKNADVPGSLRPLTSPDARTSTAAPRLVNLPNGLTMLQLARRRGMITDFGKIADPIADKALTGSALITLSALGDLPWWVTGVILVREVGVTVLRFWVIRHGVIAASRGGKIKTVLQIVAIGLYILPVDVTWLRSAAMA